MLPLAGKHARNTRNSSPLGELFDHACDNMSCAMATVQLMWIIGVEDTRLLWAVTQAFTLNFLTEHVSGSCQTHFLTPGVHMKGR